MLTTTEIVVGSLLAAYADTKLMLSSDLRAILNVIAYSIYPKYKLSQSKANAWYLFEALATKSPSKLGLVYPKPIGDDEFMMMRYSYGQFLEITKKVARVLVEKYGLKPGDRVAMDMTNTPSFMFLWFGMWSIGVIPAFINYNLTEKSLLHCVTTVNPKLFVYDVEVRDLVEPVLSQVRANHIAVVQCDDDFLQLVSKSTPFDAPDSYRDPANAWDTAAYIYTSGTTGLPKAAVMSWAKCSTGAASYAAVTGMRSSDIKYTAMPLYHSTASVLGVMACIGAGCTIAIGHKFSTRTFWHQVYLCDATIIQYVGETCRYLFNAPESPYERKHKVRMADGNGLRRDIWEKFKDRFNIACISEFYASTESPTALTNMQYGEIGIGAVGKYGRLIGAVLRRTRYTIAAVDPENREELWRDPKTGFGKEASVNEPGEILFRLADPKRAHQSFQGYTDKKANAKKMVFDVFKKGDGWFRSGDLLKKDDQGFIYFVDRMGETFRWKSENVSTTEVEHIIHDINGVDMSVVVGVQVPNHEGRAGFAVIKPKNVSSPPSPDEIAKALLTQLPRYAVPVFFKFSDKIDTTGNNKTRKTDYQNQKFPNTGENIYVLDGNTYKPLDNKRWNAIVGGSAKL